MPEITINSSQQLCQALTQLNQLSSQSDLAKAGAAVIVKHLAGNLINLHNTSSAQSISVAKTDLSGTLHSNQTYQVKVSPQGQQALVEFYPKGGVTQPSAPLTTKQLDGLLKLPANQLFAAPIPPGLLKISGEVTQSVNNQLTLAIMGSQPKHQISLAIPNAAKFTVGSQVTLELKPLAKNWQAKLSIPVDAPGPRQSAGQGSGSTSGLKPTSITQLSSTQAQPLLKTLLAQNQGTTPLALNPKTLAHVLPTATGGENKVLLDNLAKLTNPLGLRLQADTKGSLVELAPKASAQIVATEQNIKTLLQVIDTLDIPLGKSVERRLATLLIGTEVAKAVLPQAPALTRPNLSAQAALSKHQDQNMVSALPGKPGPGPQASSSASAADNVMPQPTDSEAIAPLTPKTNPVNIEAPPMSPSVKAQAIGVLHSLLRVVQARAEVPSDSLMRILGALADPQIASDPALKQLSEQLVQQVKQGIPQGKEQDASQIRQLLTSPTLSLTPAQILTPVASQGFLGGLLALVQVSLASRLSRHQPTQAQRLAEALSPLSASDTSGPVKTGSGMSPRGLNEFSQVEQKHQLLRELSRLFAGHQTSKLSNAEQLLQGQDCFHYTLPTAFGDKLQNIELLLRRGSQDSGEEDANPDPKNRLWQLTMKLSVGEMGELLTKANLRKDILEIDFYTSNEATKHQVLNFLPLLKNRLTALGIEVAKSSCQLGKIPASLQQRPYHLVQTKA